MSPSPHRLTSAARRFGLPGAAALLLAGWAGWTQWVSDPPVEAEIAELHRRVLDASGKRTVDRPTGPSAQALLDSVYSSLPDDAASNETLAAVLAQARSATLAVDTVQFHSEPARLPGVTRHQMSLPLKGRYAALRTWLAQVLKDHASLTLDSIDLKRKDVGTSELEAQVTLSLWSRASRPEAGGRRAH